MRKTIGKLFHLALGIFLLALALFSFRVLGGIGKAWWQHESAVSAQPAAQPNSDTLPDGSGLTVYGFLADTPPSKSDRDHTPGAYTGRSSPIDHVSTGAHDGRTDRMQGRLAIKTYQTFRFEIPPHTAHPELTGYFRTIDAGQQSGRGFAVEVALLNEQEFQKFGQEEEWRSIFSERPSTHADIEWALAPTYGEGALYHLVFRNASGRPGVVVLDTDFRMKGE
ncbi:MAG TPA: hypothetical protein VMT67_08025 [Terriglobales bacterium]|nr:hypothetical protein [Terriglobales bacterium]